MQGEGDIKVKSKTLTLKPDQVGPFVEMVASALGGHQMSAGVSEEVNQSHYKFSMGGKELELYVRSRKSGEVTLAFPAATADEDVAMVLNAIRAVKTRIYVGNVGVSLGFRRLHEPLHIGLASLAPLRFSRKHGGRTGWNSGASGEVVDHALISKPPGIRGVLHAPAV